jgi:hypothetical protein
MKTKNDSMDWFPMWIDKWIFGSTRIELKPDERSVYVDLLALASKDHGFIRANVGIAYPIIQLAGLLCISEELLLRTINKCLDLKIGKLLECPNGGGYFMPSWGEYQLSDRHKRRFRQNIEEINKHGRNWGHGVQKEDVMSPEPAPIGEDIKKRRGEDTKSITAKSEKKTSPDIKIFIDFYFESFKEKFKEEPLIQGAKDGMNIKRLLKFIPIDQLKILLGRFFESEDPFIQNSGYTIGVFYSQINKLKLEGKIHKSRGKTFDAGDLWLKIKEEQRERRGPANIQISDGKSQGISSVKDPVNT